jgi:hypothetical protein
LSQKRKKKEKEKERLPYFPWHPILNKWLGESRSRLNDIQHSTSISQRPLNEEQE